MARSASSVSMPLGLFIVLPEEDKDFSYALDLLCTGTPADLFHYRAALVALEGAGAHLDEFVRLERAVDLGHHFVGKAFRPDPHHRLELVRARHEGSAFGRRQHE